MIYVENKNEKEKFICFLYYDDTIFYKLCLIERCFCL